MVHEEHFDISNTGVSHEEEYVVTISVCPDQAETSPPLSTNNGTDGAAQEYNDLKVEQSEDLEPMRNNQAHAEDESLVVAETDICYESMVTSEASTDVQEKYMTEAKALTCEYGNETVGESEQTKNGKRETQDDKEHPEAKPINFNFLMTVDDYEDSLEYSSESGEESLNDTSSVVERIYGNAQ